MEDSEEVVTLGTLLQPNPRKVGFAEADSVVEIPAAEALGAKESELMGFARRASMAAALARAEAGSGGPSSPVTSPTTIPGTPPSLTAIYQPLGAKVGEKLTDKAMEDFLGRRGEYDKFFLYHSDYTWDQPMGLYVPISEREWTVGRDPVLLP
eukprot:RCo052284